MADGGFDADTAIERVSGGEGGGSRELVFTATLVPEWQALRGPHGGYLAAILLRALIASSGDDARAPRSLTIHYASVAKVGAVLIRTALERRGRSLSTLSARMEQDGAVIALALAAFSVPWSAPEIGELPIPEVAAPDAALELPVEFEQNIERGLAPVFLRRLLMQPRVGAPPRSGFDGPMEVGSWLGLRERERPLDALAIAMLSDVGAPPPLMRLREPASASTVDLTIHFRTRLAANAQPSPDTLCFASMRTRVVHEGFFEDDGVIWARDGSLLAQSRQLAILMPLERR